MLLVTKKRVTGLVKTHPITQLPQNSSKDIAQKIKNVLAGPLSEFAPSVAQELGKTLKADYDASAGRLDKEIVGLLETISDTSLLTVGDAVNNHVKASFLHIEVGEGVKALHSEGKGSVDKVLMA